MEKINVESSEKELKTVEEAAKFLHEGAGYENIPQVIDYLRKNPDNVSQFCC